MVRLQPAADTSQTCGRRLADFSKACLHEEPHFVCGQLPELQLDCGTTAICTQGNQTESEIPQDMRTLKGGSCPWRRQQLLCMSTCFCISSDSVLARTAWLTNDSNHAWLGLPCVVVGDGEQSVVCSRGRCRTQARDVGQSTG